MDFWTDSQEDCRLQHMCILLEHANHKELLNSINNGVKTLEIAVTASRWETRCCINILYYRYMYHGIRNIYQKIYKLRKDVIVRGEHDICSITYTYIYILLYH